ncbi:proline-rich protein 35 [Chanos chanos]|uniref:Proline-rich protein 35 n=1 Tax=Chanos chanos TaxID=29144 RepID=A0A6J2V2K9_CHACN|nr:proline-rich protein 35 [Chanos chanos]
MSKEEATCKSGSGSYKHKERKPKKPHYIPRPWGKPYNYKCFQCPFTCMEKSHLYNHMKYSLCKNSLSLLIESDWPYKKGNLLHPDRQHHLRLQQGSAGSSSPTGERSEQAAEEPVRPDQNPEIQISEEGEDGEGGAAQSDAADDEAAANEVPGPERACPRAARSQAKQEADLVMADAFSLEEQLLRARSVEMEAKLRRYKLSKTALLSEHSLPCYPPPGPPDPPETNPLNLSLLGVGYPLAPGLFSYLNPALNPTHTPVGSLPFLTSATAAQLTHTHADRAVVPPRLYYPFLCEHAFGTSAETAAKAVKPPSVNQDSAASPYAHTLSLWRVPPLRHNSGQASLATWVSTTHPSPEPAYRAEEASQTGPPGREAGVKRWTETSEGPAGKRAALGFSLDFLKNIHTIAPSGRPISDSSSLSNSSTQRTREQTEEREKDAAGFLLQDLTTAIHEYQSAERQAATLREKERLSDQHHLWAHLGKIRSELSQIQQALLKTTRHTEGPLDLSFKKDTAAAATKPGDGTEQGIVGETKEAKDYVNSEMEEEEEEEEEETGDEREVENEGIDMKERRKRSLDALIKLSHASVPMVKSEVLSAQWLGRTTKCEADSSVLLGPDARTVVFNAKTPNRPPSIPLASLTEHLQPPSPLTSTDA